MKSMVNNLKILVALGATTIGFAGFLSAQTPTPEQSSPSPSADAQRHSMHEHATRSASADTVPDESVRGGNLTKLLQEQNKRLKAQVDQLQRENTELKAKLNEKP